MKETLLFDVLTWLVFAAPFLGFFAAGLSKRENPAIKGDRVLRHDRPARVSHWSHAIGTTVLLVSGIVLGSRFSPAFVADDAATAFWMNVHFLFVILFLFGTFFWLGNTIVSKHRFREHLPTKNVIKYTIQHYGLLLGFKKFKMPPEEKYFESERAAFILALIATVLVIITGFVKVLAHAFFLPEGFMNAMSWTHDISAALMLLFFLAHVFFAAIAPFSWPSLRSMFTGYVSLEHAEKEHAGWVEQIIEEPTKNLKEESQSQMEVSEPQNSAS